ncbi:hypothetical protein ACFYKX_13790 [Cytobacillus sp. FJAT-54145]|uniref:Flagellar hook-length control protein-like C-terminal domain-containing protein n=1 Tax=Cytobacillus spartinae TaxID=3299023 RepID=A0ABW6KBU9_9BACI
MQINNHLMSKSSSNEVPLDLRQGDIHHAQIKERRANGEVVLNIRGKEVVAKFEGQVLTEDRITIKITGQKDDVLMVRAASSAVTQNEIISGSEPKQSNIIELIGKASPELNQMLNQIEKRGIPVTKVVAKELQAFLEGAKGAIETKIDTLNALLNKNLEITTTHLRSIHEALHGKPLNNILSDIAKELEPSFEYKKAEGSASVSANPSHKINLSSEIDSLIEQLERNPDLKSVLQKVKEVINQNPKLDQELLKQVDKGVEDALKLETIAKERLMDPAKGVQEIVNILRNTPNIKKAVEEILKFLTESKILSQEMKKNLETTVKQAIQLELAGRERLVNILKQLENLISNKPNMNTQSQIQQEVISTITNDDGAKLLSQISNALKLVQKDPLLSHATEYIKNEIITREHMHTSKIHHALEEANVLKDKGREMMARQVLANTLTEIQKELQPSTSTLDNELTLEISDLIDSLQIGSKPILVTKVTEKLAQVTNDFRELKRDISRTLEQTNKLIETNRNMGVQAKQMLESTISKIDNAILKSNIMLYTDMKTEKQLMEASSQLAEAKRFLAKGEHPQAARLVQEVKTLVDKLIFKPSEQKIMNFVSKESIMNDNQVIDLKDELLNRIGRSPLNSTSLEGSARQMYDHIRSLGLNHESDVSQTLVFKKGEFSQQDSQQQQNNLKASLMKLLHGEADHNKITHQAEQALNNLTGQQLLSKADSSPMQNMFLNLTMLLGSNPENIQVFVNSNSKGQQIDWENCNIYFLLETKKLGDVGILLNSRDRNLTITIKNDKPGFKDKMAPIAQIATDRLKEIGYNINAIHFSKMSADQKVDINGKTVENEGNDSNVMFTEKGLDFKV